MYCNLFQILKLPNPHWEEQLDPDPLKMNADPQPCAKVDEMSEAVCNSDKWQQAFAKYVCL